MQKNNWIVGLVVLIVIIVVSAWGFSKSKISADAVQKVSNVASNVEETLPTADNIIKDNEPYFDANAKVMEFYQPSCGWCIKESSILVDLAKQGYRVKPMNAAADQTLWQKYNVSGTPSFVASNGDKLEGYQTEDALKAFLDSHK